MVVVVVQSVRINNSIGAETKHTEEKEVVFCAHGKISEDANTSVVAEGSQVESWSPGAMCSHEGKITTYHQNAKSLCFILKSLNYLI